MSNYYQFYENLMKIPPIKLKDSWLITKYDDVKYCLKEDKLFSVQRVPLMFSAPDTDKTNPKVQFAEDILTKWIIHKDTGATETKREVVQNLVNYTNTNLKDDTIKYYEYYLDKLRDREEYDLKYDLILPIVVSNTMSMLNMKRSKFIEEQIRTIYKHVEVVSIAVEDVTMHGNDRIMEFADSLLYLVKISAEYDGISDVFPIEDFNTNNYTLVQLQNSLILGTLVFSSINLIVNAIKVMKDHADMVTDDNIKDCILEATRIESPVQGVLRIATEDVVLRNAQIKKGDCLTVLVGAANRDGTVPEFKDPKKFDLDRKKAPLLTYGYGIHACIGQRLSMDFAQILVTRMWNDNNFEIKDFVWADEMVGYRSMRSITVTNKIHAGELQEA